MTSVGQGVGVNEPNRLLGHRWRSESVDDFFDPLGANIGAQELERDPSLQESGLLRYEPGVCLSIETLTREDEYTRGTHHALGLDHGKQVPLLVPNATPDGPFGKIQSTAELLNGQFQLLRQTHEHLRREPVTDVLDEVQVVVTVGPHPRRGVKHGENVLHSDSHE